MNAPRESLDSQAPAQHAMQVEDVLAALRRNSIACDLDGVRLSSVLGTGTFSVVFRGYMNNKAVAVKMMRVTNMDEKTAKDFRAEVELLRMVRNPHVVQLMAFSVDPPALITEYIDGESLFDLLQDRAMVVTWAQVLRWARELAEALVSVHAAGVIHRDIKTLNVLIEGRTGNVKLVDFGLSCLDTESRRHSGGKGTPHYMAPEVINHGMYDTHADIFSFGMTLWEMCTRAVPFGKRNVRSFTAAVARKDARPDMPAYIPSPLAQIIRHCWQRSPTDRPTAPELVAMLSRRDLVPADMLSQNVPFMRDLLAVPPAVKKADAAQAVVADGRPTGVAAAANAALAALAAESGRKQQPAAAAAAAGPSPAPAKKKDKDPWMMPHQRHRHRHRRTSSASTSSASSRSSSWDSSSASSSMTDDDQRGDGARRALTGAAARRYAAPHARPLVAAGATEAQHMRTSSSEDTDTEYELRGSGTIAHTRARKPGATTPVATVSGAAAVARAVTGVGGAVVLPPNAPPAIVASGGRRVPGAQLLVDIDHGRAAGGQDSPAPHGSCFCLFHSRKPKTKATAPPAAQSAPLAGAGAAVGADSGAAFAALAAASASRRKQEAEAIVATGVRGGGGGGGADASRSLLGGKKR